MINIDICDEIENILEGKIVIGVVEAKVKVKESDSILWKKICLE